MAIYDVDSIMESEYEDSTNDVLDNMLEACDQMMSALDESGGAYKKYMNMLADKDKAAKEKIDKIDSIGSGSKYHKNLHDKYHNKRIEYARKAQKYTFGPDENRKWSITNPIDDSKENIYTSSASDYVGKTNYFSKLNTIGKNEKKYLHNGKAEFKKDFGGPGGEDKLAEKQKMHDAKKKAIKETCLNILSVIDEL